MPLTLGANTLTGFTIAGRMIGCILVVLGCKNVGIVLFLVAACCTWRAAAWFAFTAAARTGFVCAVRVLFPPAVAVFAEPVLFAAVFLLWFFCTVAFAGSR